MIRNTKGLLTSAKNKTKITIAKVNNTIKLMIQNNELINFTTVARNSGVSKNYLYKNDDIRKKIEQLRNEKNNNTINQRLKFDKTAKSKDVIIAAKDKKIFKLENEIENLKSQLEVYQAKIYND